MRRHREAMASSCHHEPSGIPDCSVTLVVAEEYTA